MISIITPTYNRLIPLKRCIESVLTQCYDGLEFIVIDDNSTDGTQKYLESISNSEHFIKVINNKENKGVNFSRNRGIELATNKFILFLDSDDEFVDGCLLKILNTIKNNVTNKHFLFPVSYRLDEFNNFDVKEVYYEDWLKNTITGDFTHVVSAEIMKKYLFFEDFRAYEYLNWFRIKKETSPQLLFPIVAVEVDRSSFDSLSKGINLSSPTLIRERFKSMELFYRLYNDDIIIYQPKILGYGMLKTIILGTSSNLKKESRSILKYSLSFNVKLIGYLITFFPATFLLELIVQISIIKRKLRK